MRFDDWIARSVAARKQAHRILATHERLPSRVVLREDLAKQLSGTPVDVQDYFRESITCVERGFFRAAIVLAWAGHFHVCLESLFHKHEADIWVTRPKWSFKGLPELKEQYPEAQILDVGKYVKFIGQAQLTVLHGQLSQRNQCAHPMLYRPSMNAAIGYADEMVRQIGSHWLRGRVHRQRHRGPRGLVASLHLAQAWRIGAAGDGWQGTAGSHPNPHR